MEPTHLCSFFSHCNTKTVSGYSQKASRRIPRRTHTHPTSRTIRTGIRSSRPLTTRRPPPHPITCTTRQATVIALTRHRSIPTLPITSIPHLRDIQNLPSIIRRRRRNTRRKRKGSTSPLNEKGRKRKVGLIAKCLNYDPLLTVTVVSLDHRLNCPMVYTCI